MFNVHRALDPPTLVTLCFLDKFVHIPLLVTESKVYEKDFTHGPIFLASYFHTLLVMTSLKHFVWHRESYEGYHCLAPFPCRLVDSKNPWMPLSPQPLFILTCLCSSLSSSSFLLLLFSASLSHSKCSAFFFSSDSRHVFVLASNRKCDRIFVCPFIFKVVWMPDVCVASSVSTGACLCIIFQLALLPALQVSWGLGQRLSTRWYWPGSCHRKDWWPSRTVFSTHLERTFPSTGLSLANFKQGAVPGLPLSCLQNFKTRNPLFKEIFCIQSLIGTKSWYQKQEWFDCARSSDILTPGPGAR